MISTTTNCIRYSTMIYFRIFFLNLARFQVGQNEQVSFSYPNQAPKTLDWKKAIYSWYSEVKQSSRRDIERQVFTQIHFDSNSWKLIVVLFTAIMMQQVSDTTLRLYMPTRTRSDAELLPTKQPIKKYGHPVKLFRSQASCWFLFWKLYRTGLWNKLLLQLWRRSKLARW